jgi:hypothetical protein
MNDDVIKRAFERIAQLRAEGKLPQMTPEDYENEPTALAFTPDARFYFSDEVELNEQLYSEEDLKSAFRTGFFMGYGSPVSELDLKEEYCNKWFEQFKKK